jgi:hypothetical protein
MGAAMRSQPQGLIRLNAAHPLARDLAFAWVGSGDTDVVTGKGPKVDGVTPLRAPYGSRLGRKFIGGGDFDFGVRPDLNFSALSNQTILTEVVINDAATCSGMICGRVSSSWDYHVNVSAGSQVVGYAAGGDSSGIGWPGTYQGLYPYVDVPLIVCGTYDRVNQKLYINGQLKVSKAFTGAFANSTDPFAVGSRGGGNQTTQQLTGATVGLVLIFKRTLTDMEVASLSANPWQLFAAPEEDYESSVAPAVGAALSGTGPALASATGVLTTAIRLAGSAGATASATGTLTTGISLAGTAVAQAAAAGTLTTSIRLAGTVAGQASASGTLTTAIALAGSAAAQALASGTLTTGIALTGGASAVASAYGTLTVPTAGLTGTAQASATASGVLTTAISLAGRADAATGASGTLTTGIALAGSAGAQASATGVLTTGIALAGSAQASASASGVLGSVGVSFSGSGVAVASASGILTTAIRLSGTAAAVATAYADLTTVKARPEPATLSDMEKAVLQGLVDCNLGMPLAQPNASFQRPADGGPWASVGLGYGLPQDPTLGADGSDDHEGTLELGLHFPLLSGTAAASAAYRQLSAYFYAGRALSRQATRVTVTGCGAPRNGEHEGYYRRTVTIAWRARIDRQA